AYPLLGLTKNIFPRDPRRVPPETRAPAATGAPGRGARESTGVATRRRSPEAVPQTEIAWLLGTVFLWLALAGLVWSWLAGLETDLGIPDDVWRLIVLFWFLGLGVAAGVAFFGYLRQVLMTPDEATLYLQDVQWLETRNEQRLLNR